MYFYYWCYTFLVFYNLFQRNFKFHKFSWLIWCIVKQVYYFFHIPLLYYYINTKTTNNILPSFWRYISFFRYSFIILICNCFWIILLWIFWNFRNSAVLQVSHHVSSFIINQIYYFLIFYYYTIFISVNQ